MRFMERIIQPYNAPNLPSHAESARSLAVPPLAIPPKSASELFRAARRGLPIVLILTAVAGALGAAYVMRMPPVYKATAHVRIEPPRFDPHLAIILAGNSIPTNDRETSEKFVPDRMALLQGRALASEVIYGEQMGPAEGHEGFPEGEILANISYRKYLVGTNIFEVTLEGASAPRVTKVLSTLLDRFALKVQSESKGVMGKSIDFSKQYIGQVESQIKVLNKDITNQLKTAEIFAPGGTNLLVEDYSSLRTQLMMKRERHETLRHEDRITSMFPGLKKDLAPPSKYQRRIEGLLDLKDTYEQNLESVARMTRNVNSDPAARHWARLLNKTIDDLEALYKKDVQVDRPDQSAITLAHEGAEIERLEQQVKRHLDRIQATMPDYENYQNLVKLRESKLDELAGIRKTLAQFEMVSETRPEPVTIIQAPTEPGGPSKPNRPMLIAMSTSLGFVLGLVLVCGREYLDRSVKVPEHLSAGLTLPILSVIPRIRRISSLDRGGHLWMGGAPLAREADSYRNLRAGVIGAGGPKSPIVTMMITSAKAGEGKSTTALNLALTCARAGERTLLLEADLRRPSLSPVFDAAEPNVGLVDVLRGDMPWQQAVIRTEIANLSFLPSGDPSGVPIEILGTLELRQLIVALSGQFQRVIIDAPAILGMADCRMLGRTVDAAILVVKSGTHELRPLRRAKEMLEQSRVPIAGLVFNGLTDDLENWSCLSTAALPQRAPARAAIGEASPALVEAQS